MPDPLLGFALQSFVPLVQVETVSGATALMSLERPDDLPELLPAAAMPKHHASTTTAHGGRAVETPLAYRALLHTRVRHTEPGV
jgi:hypothetical protein